MANQPTPFRNQGFIADLISCGETLELVARVPRHQLPMAGGTSDSR